MNQREIELLQDRIAELAIGPSTLRNQGAPGVVSRAKRFIKNLDLACFSLKSRSAFSKALDNETNRLKRSFPPGARNWGAARKSLNIFLRDCLYSRYLCAEFRLDRLEPWLEVPLDRYTATALRRTSQGWLLPPWPSIKHLKPQVNRQYQDPAREVAGNMGIAPVHLDLHYWRQGRRRT